MTHQFRIVLTREALSPALGLEGFPPPDVPERSLFAMDQNGRPVGWAALCSALHGQPLQPGSRILYLWVQPEERRNGIGTALLGAVMEQAYALGVTRLDSCYGATTRAAEAFASRHGFQPDYQMLDLELVLSGYDLDRWRPVLERVCSQGIRLAHLGEEPDRLAVERAIWELDYRLSVDVLEWSGEVVPFEEYRQENLAGEGFEPEGVILAWDGDRLVGLSGTKVEPTGSGYIWFAGVDRAHRRRSIALAMKVLTIEWATARGLDRLNANNNAASHGVVALNRKMGFAVTAARQYAKRSL